MQPITALAPAKINLFLQVTGRRFDGYHSLQSFVFFADIGDRVILAPAAEPSLAVSGPYAASLPPQEQNLALRALQALGERIPDLPPFAVHLEKNLPVAAGIGGGSSDAATVIRLALEITGIRLEEKALQNLLLSLGADVPVCFAARPAMMQGVGDVMQLWPSLPDYGVMLVNPGKALLTKEVFAALTEFSAPQSFTLPATKEDWRELMRRTSNDLTAPALKLCPEIAGVLKALESRKQCLLARMSGSGATCFGLFTNLVQAKAAAQEIQKKHPEWWVKAGGIYGT